MTYKKKLIEVALPLESINIASAKEKSIRHGHPSTLHLWWARRPLAAARAIIFSQMIDDPSGHPDIFKTVKSQETERLRLFKIIEELVKWENTTNQVVLQSARDEIWKSWRYTCSENKDHPNAKIIFNPLHLPSFHDPFAGGGAIPLEAQRLGLESRASDLNPVAVLINKAMIEVPPRFTGKPPINPDSRKGQAHTGSWQGAQGLAEDVRYYGKWMRTQAEKRIGHFYPQVEINAAIIKKRPDLKRYENQKVTVIAWIWARTVKSPNPAFANVDVPLASTYMLSAKPGKEAFVVPIIDRDEYHFEVNFGIPSDLNFSKNGSKLARGANFKCIMSNEPIDGNYIKAEGKAGRMGSKLMAIVAEGINGRIFLSPTQEHEVIAKKAIPDWKPDVTISGSTQYLGVKPYGFNQFSEIFSGRQLVALTTFSDLVKEAHEYVKSDAIKANFLDDGKTFENDGFGATAYADAISVYLAFSIDKAADYWSTVCTWHSSKELIRNTFGRQAIPMTWDYAETNVFSESSGNVSSGIDWAYKALNMFPATAQGFAYQADAQSQNISLNCVVSTDPPYYDNIPYADLSDYFYIWLRRSLKTVFPKLFATVAVPKTEELVAFAYRHKTGKVGAGEFFLDGMTKAMHRLAVQAHPLFPVTIYYAFKQSESDGQDGITSTGWDTFLEAVIEAGFEITGTWPIRTELANKLLGVGSNMLASSIVLVCRIRSNNAVTATRREFVVALKTELPTALAHLQAGNIAPVDLAQAAIGPGMAVYTRFAKVMDAVGNPLTVRAALALINQTLDEALAEQEGDFDGDTRWALTWFDQVGFAEGDYGVAEQLSKSKNTSIDGLVEGGILISTPGKVRLLKPMELESNWNPNFDKRITVWEIVHQLIRVLEAGGEDAASEMVAILGGKAETARELCYRLYTLCERKKRANEAMSYNGLVQSWPEITRLAREKPAATKVGTTDMFEQE